MTQPFFVAGGALRADAPSYVERAADDILYNLALDGHFAYVLTSRQMGKSSLMNRTARRLTETGVQTVRIDLTGIGVVTIDEWYFGLLTELQRQLRLDVDLYEWWAERDNLSHIQRFIAFLREIVLGQLDGQVIIFIDEIDTTLKLAYADDFFAGIRSIYNGRDAEPAWDRLSFILLGVATPSDLVQDNSRTPFNIGQGVELLDFSHEEGQLLQAGLAELSADQQAAVFAHIYQWTDGHPYMTQQLCEQVTQDLSDEDGTEFSDQVDALVTRLFLSEKAQNEKNLSYVRDRIVEHPQRRQLLQLYRAVLRGKAVQEDRQSVVQNELKLAALVKEKDGNLQVRNRIYAENFDLAWVKVHTQINWTAVAAWSLGVIAFLAVALIGYDFIVDYRVSKAKERLSESPGISINEHREDLALLFRARQIIGQADYQEDARKKFYSYSWDSQNQIGIFIPNESIEQQDILIIVDGLSMTLANTGDIPDNLSLLKQMYQAVEYIQSTPIPHLQRFTMRDNFAHALRAELEHWINGRGFVSEGKIALALTPYAATIAINNENPATLFERAKLLIAVEDYDAALNDLEQLLGVVRRVPTTTSTEEPTISGKASPSSTPSPGTSPTTDQIIETVVTGTPMPMFTASVKLSDSIVGEAATLDFISTPTPSPTPAFYQSKFVIGNDQIQAVRILLSSDQDLADSLFEKSNGYPNLDEFNLIPTVTPALPILIPNEISDPATGFYNRGNVYYHQGDYDKAISDFGQAILLDPNNANFYSNRGAAYRALDEYNKAIADYNEAIKLDQDSAATYNNRGNVYKDDGKYNAAIADFDKAVELDPGFAFAYNNRGLVYYAQGKYHEALFDYDKAIELDDKYADAYYNRGNVYYRQGEYDKSISDFDRAILLDPNDAKFSSNRGSAYRRQGEYDKAIDSYNQAIDLEPEAAGTYNNLGNVYSDQGDYDEAINNFNKAIELDLDFVYAYNNRGLAYHGQDKYDEALSDYGKAIELDDKYADAYYNRGNVYYQQGEYDKAIVEYGIAIELDPNDFRAYNNRGVAYKAQGKYDQAISNYMKVLELNPNDVGTYNNLCRIYTLMEQPETALPYCEKVGQ